MLRVDDSIKARLKETEAIDSKFQLERAGRAQKLLDELDAALKSYAEETVRYIYQVRQLMNVTPSTLDSALLTGLLDKMIAENHEIASDASTVGQVQLRLKAIVSPPK